MKLKHELVFVAAKRTPFGAFTGSLKSLTATDLAVEAAKACLSQGNVSPADIDATIVGNVVQSSRDAIYIARHTGLRAGVPIDRPALIVNRLCGSGFEAIAQGAYLIETEGLKTILVGGSESMSQVPYVLRGARDGYRLGPGELEDYLMASLVDTYTGLPMAITAENLAERYHISRDEVDAYALESQQRTAAAIAENRFADEIAPVEIVGKKGTVRIERDEHPRPDSNLAALSKLKPVFKKDGVVTAGNASGMVDGAAMLILTTAENAQAKGWKPLGRLHTWAATGCDPSVMGIGPVPATQLALKRFAASTGKSISVTDFKRIEVNEAFAPQYLSVERELKLPHDRTNSNGGAIAIGHPLAASGARLVAHLLYDLKRLGGGLGLASACIGGGQGMSVIVEVL